MDCEGRQSNSTGSRACETLDIFCLFLTGHGHGAGRVRRVLVDTFKLSDHTIRLILKEALPSCGPWPRVNSSVCQGHRHRSCRVCILDWGGDGRTCSKVWHRVRVIQHPADVPYFTPCFLDLRYDYSTITDFASLSKYDFLCFPSSCLTSL